MMHARARVTRDRTSDRRAGIVGAMTQPVTEELVAPDADAAPTTPAERPSRRRGSCSCGTRSPRTPARCSRAACPASISPTRVVGQAEAAADRLAKLPIAAIYASPIERTTQTAQAIAAHHGLEVLPLPGVIEADYGDWTGGKIADLAKTDEWKVVQVAPSRARFPGGESIREMQARTVERARRPRRRAPARDRRRRQPRRSDQVGDRALHGHAPRPVPAGTCRAGVGHGVRLPRVRRAAREVQRHRRPRRPPPRAGRSRGEGGRGVTDHIEFDPVDAIGAGAFGDPGARTFVIQARKGDALLSVLVEKEQVRCSRPRPSSSSTASRKKTPRSPLDPMSVDDCGPVEEDEPLFRARLIGIGYDPERHLVLIELREEAVDEDEPPPPLDDSEGRVARLYATRAQVRAMVAARRGVDRRGPTEVPALRLPDGSRRAHLPALELSTHLPDDARPDAGRSEAQARELLRDGDIDVLGRMPWSSNATFLVNVTSNGDEMLGIYKPQRGERPLWDFPRGTLCHREVAAYELSDVARLGHRARHRAARRSGRHRHDAAVRRARSRRALLHVARTSTATTSGAWPRSTSSSTTPTARAATACAPPTAASSGSTTASRSTRSGSCARSSGTSAASRLPEAVAADLQCLADRSRPPRARRAAPAVARPLRARRDACACRSPADDGRAPGGRRQLPLLPLADGVARERAYAIGSSCSPR